MQEIEWENPEMMKDEEWDPVHKRKNGGGWTIHP